MPTKSNKITTKFAIYSVIMALNINSINAQSSNEQVNDYKCESYDLGELGSYVLQGICVIGNKTLITAYSNDDENSKIYVLNENNEIIKETLLYNNAHVGGICYDYDHDYVWITDKGTTISAYKLDDILTEKIILPEYKQINIGGFDFCDIQSVAYITYDDNKIFVGNYSNSSLSVIRSFEIRTDGFIKLNTCKEAKFTKQVQGVTFYEKDNNKYIIVSSSYGPIKKSKLKIYKYNKNITNYNDVNYIEFILPPMLEQITVSEQEKLISLFEINASKYKIFSNDQKDVVEYDIEKMKTKDFII